MKKFTPTEFLKLLAPKIKNQFVVVDKHKGESVSAECFVRFLIECIRGNI